MWFGKNPTSPLTSSRGSVHRHGEYVNCYIANRYGELRTCRFHIEAVIQYPLSFPRFPRDPNEQDVYPVHPVIRPKPHSQDFMEQSLVLMKQSVRLCLRRSGTAHLSVLAL